MEYVCYENLKGPESLFSAFPSISIVVVSILYHSDLNGWRILSLTILNLEVWFETYTSLVQKLNSCSAQLDNNKFDCLAYKFSLDMINRTIFLVADLSRLFLFVCSLMNDETEIHHIIMNLMRKIIFLSSKFLMSPTTVSIGYGVYV